jgi:hypothetical protein
VTYSGDRTWSVWRAEAYKDLVARVAEIHLRHDSVAIAHLVGDDYRSEAGTIVQRLTQASSPTDVHRIVAEEFTRAFGPEYSTGLESAADDVWLAVEAARRQG